MEPSKAPCGTMSCTISVFGCLCQTKSMHRTVHLSRLVQARSVRRNRAYHASRDGVVRRMARDSCVIHSKLTSMHATKYDLISYWTNNKDNQTRLSARFEHASHHPGPALHPGSPSPKQPITPIVKSMYLEKPKHLLNGVNETELYNIQIYSCL